MLPLENVRILDFTHVPPGQFCAMMLGEIKALCQRGAISLPEAEEAS